MRVLFYHSAREWSGRARVFSTVARGLAERGYQVTFVCRPDSAVEQRISQYGYEVVPIEMGDAWLWESWRLRQVLLDRFVEVIFTHTEREQLVAAAATRLAARGAVLRRTPAGGRVAAGSRSKLAARLATTGFVFTTPTDMQNAPPVPAALEPVLAGVGVDAEQYDAVKPASRQSMGLRAPGTIRVLVCVYDPSARIRAATVLRTVAMLAPHHPDLRVAMVGVGSDHEDLKMHAAALGVTRIVSHLGERDDLLSVLRAADIGWVIADSDNAAFGVLDLMALRVPVLAERGTVAQRYVADGITGMLLPPGDAPSTAAALATFLSHDDQRLAMGNAARVRVARELTERTMLDQFEQAVTVARDRTRWAV